MKILFVVSTLQLGGIETYLSRVVPQLRIDNYEIDVHVLNKNFDPGLLSIVEKSATVKFFNNTKRLGNVFPYGGIIENKYDLIYVTGISSLLYVLMSPSLKSLDIKLMIGVYFQFEFTENLDRYRNKKIFQFLNTLPAENICFCTDGCKLDFIKMYGERFQSSIVSPLYSHVGSHAIERNKYFSKKIKILSVGRLVAFKNYNIYLPSIIRCLIDNGVDVSWTVVGSGPLVNVLNDEIQKNNIKSHVTIIGSVPYENLHKYYREADLYIGAGTTLIEASSYGKPSICTIDNCDRPISTGYFHDRKGYTTSDILDGESTFDVYQMIYDFAHLAGDVKNSMAFAARNASLKYDINNANKDFAEMASAAKSISTCEFEFSRARDLISLVRSAFF